ncbi:MAG: hypothetical protein R3F43_01320 [bacterium]
MPNRLPGTYSSGQAVDGADARYTLEVEVTPAGVRLRGRPQRAQRRGDDGDGSAPVRWIGRRGPVALRPRPRRGGRLPLPRAGAAGRTVAATFLYGDDGDLALEIADAAGNRLATTAAISREISGYVRIPSFVADRTLYRASSR